MEQFKQDFLVRALGEARLAGHIFPDIAICEAALESRWGKSELAIAANNLFGEKQHQSPIFETYYINTRENVDLDKDGKVEPHEVITLKKAAFVKFPDWATSFRSRMDTLRRLAPRIPNYAKALNAQSPEAFVKFVSASWATDPLRADSVLKIYKQYWDWARTCTWVSPQ